VDIDGSGEVCPCKMVPLSFGNVGREPLGTILDRMGRHFRHPRAQCVARVLARHVPAGPLPMEPDASLALCQARLPASHGFPALFAALPRSP